VLFTEDSNKVMVQGNSKDNSNFIINYFKVADLIQKQVLIFFFKDRLKCSRCDFKIVNAVL
jgi:hypothetical protein